jgi:hypothetical protein
VFKRCSNRTNTECRCRPGTYHIAGELHCTGHTLCPAGKCLAVPGTHLTDNVCAKCPNGTFTSEPDTTRDRIEHRSTTEGVAPESTITVTRLAMAADHLQKPGWNGLSIWDIGLIIGGGLVFISLITLTTVYTSQLFLFHRQSTSNRNVRQPMIQQPETTACDTTGADRPQSFV